MLESIAQIKHIVVNWPYKHNWSWSFSKGCILSEKIICRIRPQNIRHMQYWLLNHKALCQSELQYDELTIFGFSYAILPQSVQIALIFSSPSGISCFVGPPHNWQKLIFRMCPCIEVILLYLDNQMGEDAERARYESTHAWGPTHKFVTLSSTYRILTWMRTYYQMKRRHEHHQTLWHATIHFAAIAMTG